MFEHRNELALGLAADFSWSEGAPVFDSFTRHSACADIDIARIERFQDANFDVSQRCVEEGEEKSVNRYELNEMD